MIVSILLLSARATHSQIFGQLARLVEDFMGRNSGDLAGRTTA